MEEKYPFRRDYPTVAGAIGLSAIFLVTSLVSGFLSSFLLFLNIDQSWIFLVAYTVSITITVFAGVQFRKERSGETGFRMEIPSIAMIFVILITAAAFMVVIDPLTSIFPIPDWFEEMMYRNIGIDLPSFLMIVVMAPVFEEMLFRGIMLEGFLRNYKPAKAIILSALIFGVIHMNPWQAFGAFLLGLFIGWIYWKTKSLVISMLIHMVNNLASFVLMWHFGKEALSMDQLFSNPFAFYLFYIFAFIIAMAGLILLNNRYKTATAE